MSYQLGCLIAAVMLIAVAAMAVLKPASAPADAPLVLSRQSGALYVRIGPVLHPVANLTSARLILGSPVAPRLVDDDLLGSVERGPLLGIAGAPIQIGPPISPTGAGWSVCDNADRTTSVAIGPAADVHEEGALGALLVRAAHGDGTAYLLYDGRRAVIDLGDPVIERTFHLAGVNPRALSLTLLNLIPEVSPIIAPRIPGLGGQSMLSGLPIGTVLQVTRAGMDERYVALRDGLQRVGRVAADLLLFADPHSTAGIVTVAPEVISGSPLVDALPVATYPDEVPTMLDGGGRICAGWTASRIVVAQVAAPDDGWESVELVRADGDGPAVDFASIPRGRSVDVSAPALAGESGSGSRYVVTDAGVRFAIHDSETAAALGLTGPPVVGPWSLIGALPEGPALSRTAALVAQDVLGAGTAPPV